MKRLMVAGVLSAIVLMGCTPQQEINVSVNRPAQITNVVRFDESYHVSARFTGHLWCNRPVQVDFFLRVTQDGQDAGASDETIACNSDEPAAWSQVFEFSSRGSQVPHVGTRAVLTLQASTNESGRENNDFVQLERFIDFS